MTDPHPRPGSPLPQEAHARGDAETIPVLAAVIQRRDQVLICLRPAHKRHSGLWEFPGGKIEPGESLLDAARRELAEELGVEVTTVGEVLLAVRDPGSAFVIEFLPVEIAGEPRALEHQEVRWVLPRDLARLPLAPSDQRFREWRWG